MALPTLTSTTAAWTKIPTADGVGPDLYYASLVDSIGTTVLLSVGGGAPVVGSLPDVTEIEWTSLPATGGGPAILWAAISTTPHSVYLLPDGRLIHT